MSVRLTAVTLDAYDPGRVAAFWAGVLGRVVINHDRGPLVPGSPTQVGLRFAPSRETKVGLNRVHLHLTTTSATGQQDTVAATLDRGAEHLDLGQRLEEGHVVLADPEGNEFCVIEPSNAFLAGCGQLGEVACEGIREVGLFWAEALGWPLVWDEDQETAIQSPHGGTKVAWGGPPVAPKHGRNRQRFELAADDAELGSEIERLIALGATLLDRSGEDAVELADPDGTEFLLTRADPALA